MSDHYNDALSRVSELAVVMSALTSECIEEAGLPAGSFLIERLIALRSLAELTGVIAERYGAGYIHSDRHLLAPLPLDALLRFENQERAQ
jgi:hypothetical protein